MLIIQTVEIQKDALAHTKDQEGRIKYEKEKVAQNIGLKICTIVPFCESETETVKRFEQRLQVFPEPMWQEFRQKLFNRLSALSMYELRKMFEELDASMIRSVKREDDNNG